VFVVSLAGATTVQDALDRINGSSALVDAAINDAGNGLVIRDIADGAGNLEVESLYGTGAAASLGIEGEGSGAELSGSSLRDNIRITLRDGTVVGVNLGGAATVQDILDAINGAHAHLTATLTGYGITVSDTSGGLGAFSIESLNGCTAAADLGLNQSVAASSMAGSALAAGVVSGRFTNISDVAGGSAGDLIIGGGEGQTLTGGDGGDTFVFRNGWGADTSRTWARTARTPSTSPRQRQSDVHLPRAGGLSVTDGTNTLARTDRRRERRRRLGRHMFVFEDAPNSRGPSTVAAASPPWTTRPGPRP
jgi:hypothetical protein